MKKLSILGLVLIAASAVTSAFIPSKSNLETGQLTPGETTEANTCIEDEATPANNDCNFTDVTVTSASGINQTSADNGSSAAGVNTSA